MRGKSVSRILLVSGCLALSMVGCSAEMGERLKKIIFDVADEPTPTRRLRRNLLQEIEDLKRQLASAQEEAKAAAKQGGGRVATAPVEKAKTWEEAAELLPKDKGGRTDWVRALNEKKIVPRSGVDSDAPAQAVLDLEVDLATSPSKAFHVKFQHAPHTEWLACKSCHPDIYPLGSKGKRTAITMAKINQGQSCGVCHGTVAFSAAECARCHAASPAKDEWKKPEKVAKPIERAETWEEAAKLLPVTAGTVDWSKALADGVIAPRPGIDPKAQDQTIMPLDVELVPAAGAMFKAVFSHQAHTAWLACTDCHNGIFQMAKGTSKITMEAINGGKFCGVCHGKVAFPATACARCHPTSPAKDEWKKPEKVAKPIERAETWEEAAKLLPVTAGTVDWSKALADGVIAPRPGIDPKAQDQTIMPLDVELVPAAGAMFKAVFSHQAHTAWLACTDCHNGIFQMAKGTSKITMEAINGGKFCGVCHGKVAFPPTACARCHPAMAGGK